MVSGPNAGFAGTAQPQSMKWWSGAWRANTFKSAVRAAVWNSADAPCWCSSRRRWSWSLIYSLVTFIPLNLLHRRRTEPCQLLIFLTGGTGSWYEFLKVLYIVSFPCLADNNWFILGKGVRPLYHTPLFISVTGSCVCKYLQHILNRTNQHLTCFKASPIFIHFNVFFPNWPTFVLMISQTSQETGNTSGSLCVRWIIAVHSS